MMGKSIVDLHSHIIPGVDDGSTSLDMSMHMLRSAQAQGVSTVFATSHSFAYDYDPAEVREGFGRLKEVAALQLPSMHLYLGCEISCSAHKMDYKLRMLETGAYPTMNGTKYVLAEFRTYNDDSGIKYCTHQLLEAGYIPIIAHAERYDLLTMGTAERLASEGALYQCNFYSFGEERNPAIKERAGRFMDARLVAFLGTDAHRSDHRPPKIEAGLTYLRENYDPEYVEQITSEQGTLLRLL